MAEKLDSQQVIDLIEQYVKYYAFGTMKVLLNFQEIQDLIHEVWVKFLRHQYLEKYDSDISSLRYYVKIGVKTTLIDIIRKEKNLRTEKRLNELIKNNDGLVEQIETVQAHFVETSDIVELVEILKDMEKNTKQLPGDQVKTPLGTFKPSIYAVYLHYLVQYSMKEIGAFFGFTGARAGQLVMEAERFLVFSGIRKPVLKLGR